MESAGLMALPRLKGVRAEWPHSKCKCLLPIPISKLIQFSVGLNGNHPTVSLVSLWADNNVVQTAQCEHMGLPTP